MRRVTGSLCAVVWFDASVMDVRSQVLSLFAIVVEIKAYTLGREPRPFGVCGFESRRWHCSFWGVV